MRQIPVSTLVCKELAPLQEKSEQDENQLLFLDLSEN